MNLKAKKKLLKGGTHEVVRKGEYWRVCVCKKSKHSKTIAVYNHLVYQGKPLADLDIYKDS